MSSEKEERIALRHQRALAKLHASRDARPSGDDDTATAAPSAKSTAPSPEAAAAAQEATETLSSLRDTSNAQLQEVAHRGANTHARRASKQRNKRQAMSAEVDAHLETLQDQCTAFAQSLPSFEQLPPRDPLQVYQIVQDASNTVAAMLADHDHMLTNLRVALTDADAEYVAALQRHAEHVDDVLTAMAHQANELEEQCRQQVAHVQDVLQHARQEDMERIRGMVEELLNARAVEEGDMQMAWLKQRETQWGKLEATRRTAETHHMHSTQRLQEQLAAMHLQLRAAKATHACNADKLVYNIAALTERQTQHTAALGPLKRKVTAARATVARLKKQYAAAVRQRHADTARLRRDHAHVSTHLLALQAKCARMEVNESFKLGELWSMEHGILETLAGRVQQLDAWLTKHVLHVPWGRTVEADCGTRGAVAPPETSSPTTQSSTQETVPGDVCDAAPTSVNTSMVNAWQGGLQALRAVLSPEQVDTYTTMHKVVQQLRHTRMQRCQLEQQAEALRVQVTALQQQLQGDVTQMRRSSVGVPRDVLRVAQRCCAVE